MDREEHLQWCKDRAMEYVKTGDLTQAFASFSSDMSKHKETKDHAALHLGTQLMFSGRLSTPESMEEWILGFN